MAHDPRGYATRMSRGFAGRNLAVLDDSPASAALTRRAWPRLAVGLVLFGIVIRMVEYAVVRPVSIDEAAMARTILAHGWTSVLGPLDFGQVAPAGFLILQTLALSVSTHELALRLFPLAASVAGLPMAFDVARRVCSSSVAACFVFALSIASPLVAYAATGKPYAFDVTVSTLILLVVLRADRPASWRAALVPGVGAALLVLWSFTAVFLLAGAAAAALWRAWQRPQERGAHVTCAVCWGAGAGVGYLLGQAGMSARDAEYMQWFWGAGFPSAGIGPLDLARWIWHQLRSFFGQTLHYRASSVCVLLWVIGFFSLARRRADAAFLLASPLLLVATAGALHLYPFTPGRVGLFLVPPVLLLVAEGAERTGRLFRRAGALAAAFPLLLLAATAVYGAVRRDVPPDIDRPAVRPFLDVVHSSWQPGDRLFVHYMEAQQYLYYAPRFGFRAEDVVIGACSRGVGRPYLRDAATLAGSSRAWVAMSHRRDIEVDLLRSFLDAIGVRQWPATEDLDRGYGYRYDLAASRGAGTRADTFPLPDALDHAQPFRWSCYGVFEPRRPDR